MSTKFLGALFALALTFALVTWGCGSSSPSLFDPDASTDDSGGGGPDGDFQFPDAGNVVDACQGLVCQIPTCSGGGTTSLTGTVYAPNGTLPLYNVIVYVPNAPLDPFTPGVTCDQCGVLTSGSPIAVTLTDAKGNFKLDNVPAGTDIPLVMQVGKWRRKITVPTVSPCTSNAVGQKSSGVEQLTRLPKNQKEGDMPHIAITTGGCDQLSCIMPKIGIDPMEYAPGPTNAATKPKKAISFYSAGGAGAPTGSPDATPFWNDAAQLKNFDIAIFSCECYEATPETKDATSWKAVRQYLDAGGRVFTTDFQYTWYKDGPDPNLSSAPWDWYGGAPWGGPDPFYINTTFPKGKSFADWLYYVSGISPYNTQVSQNPPIHGQFPVAVPFDNIHAYNAKYGVEWATQPTANHPRFVTMNMPSAQPSSMQCGKAVHLDAHISSADSVDSSFPAGCNQNIKETELATVFFLFDLSSCIQNDMQPPVPPTPQ